GPVAVAWSRVHVPVKGSAHVSFSPVKPASIAVRTSSQGSPASATNHFWVQSADGRAYSYHSFESGEHYVCAAHGDLMGIATFAAEAGKEARVNVPLQESSSLTIKTLREGKPAPPSAYLIHESGYVVDYDRYQSPSGPGALHYPALTPGSYILHVQVADHGWKTKTIELRPGSANTETIRFP
ncbi:MAG: hypothetical protein P1V35_15115, partial [Planctomycetota bacterium]|nr:hypothetical protein [Planctomycetota bacterium]